MKALFVTAAVLIITFFAGAVYIALSSSPETPREAQCRQAVAAQFDQAETGYTGFAAMLRDARKRGEDSPHTMMNKAYQDCLENPDRP